METEKQDKCNVDFIETLLVITNTKLITLQNIEIQIYNVEDTKYTIDDH